MVGACEQTLQSLSTDPEIAPDSSGEAEVGSEDDVEESEAPLRAPPSDDSEVPEDRVSERRRKRAGHVVRAIRDVFAAQVVPARSGGDGNVSPVFFEESELLDTADTLETLRFWLLCAAEPADGDEGRHRRAGRMFSEQFRPPDDLFYTPGGAERWERALGHHWSGMLGDVWKSPVKSQETSGAAPEHDPEEQQIHFLTVQESVIDSEGESQRRGGLHVETPGRILLNGEWFVGDPHKMTAADQRIRRARSFFWQFFKGEAEEDSEKDSAGQCAVRGPQCGGGSASETYFTWGGKSLNQVSGVGGIFHASSVSGSAAMYPKVVRLEPKERGGREECADMDAPRGRQTVIGAMGSVEHLRAAAGPPRYLQANELCWMTDRTLHESMPLPKGTRRQYFRLITGPVSGWFAQHSTANPHPEVSEALQRTTTVIAKDKFDCW